MHRIVAATKDRIPKPQVLEIRQGSGVELQTADECLTGLGRAQSKMIFPPEHCGALLPIEAACTEDSESDAIVIAKLAEGLTHDELEISPAVHDAGFEDLQPYLYRETWKASI